MTEYEKKGRIWVPIGEVSADVDKAEFKLKIVGFQKREKDRAIRNVGAF